MSGGTRFNVLRTGALAALAAAGLALAATPAQAKKAVSDVYGFGRDGQGLLGTGAKSTKPRVKPEALPNLGGVVQVARSDESSLAVLDDGGLMAWGANGHGQLGNGSTTNATTPIPVPGLSGVKAAAVGVASLALLSNGTVEAWGRNKDGEVGDGTTEDKLSPVPVPGLSEVVAISASGEHSLAVLSDGSVVEWGHSYTLFQVNNTSPVTVPGISGAVAVAAGDGFALALLSDGEVVSWGYTLAGELGNGEFEGADTAPQRVCAIGTGGACPEGPYLTGVKAVAAGGFFGLALLEDGTVASWGSNSDGALGVGDAFGPEECGGNDCSVTPLAVKGLSGVTAIGASDENFALAVMAGGTVEGWGSQDEGDLGTSNKGDALEPVPAATGLTGIVGIATGNSPNYVFGSPNPVVTKSKTGKGSAATTVTITGINLLTASAVHFGEAAATSVTVLSPTSITATAPALEPGTYNVTVTSPSGTSAPVAKAVYKVR
jgi:alpha-tubulin suppressor-like RCC1 family protein